MIRVEINPDEEYVRYIKKKLKDNNKHRLSATVKNKDTKCKCKEFMDQIERGETGYCECGLYIAVEEDD